MLNAWKKSLAYSRCSVNINLGSFLSWGFCSFPTEPAVKNTPILSLSAGHHMALPHTPPWPECKHVAVLDLMGGWKKISKKESIPPATKYEGSNMKKFRETVPWDGQLAAMASESKMKENNASERRCVSIFHKDSNPSKPCLLTSTIQLSVSEREKKTGKNGASFRASRKQPKEINQQERSKYVLISYLPQAPAHILSS